MPSHFYKNTYIIRDIISESKRLNKDEILKFFDKYISVTTQPHTYGLYTQALKECDKLNSEIHFLKNFIEEEFDFKIGDNNGTKS
jgi:hypothetical protein